VPLHQRFINFLSVALGCQRMCFNTRLLPQKLLLAVEWATWVLLQLLLMFQQTEVHHTNIGGAGGADAETQPAVGTPRPGYGM